MITTITDTSQFDLVLGLIHDRFFALSEVMVQDGSKSTLALKESKGFWRPTFSSDTGTLTIHNVISLEVNDTEQVEFYDINLMEFSEEGTLTIRTGIPLDIRFKVSSLLLSIEDNL